MKNKRNIQGFAILEIVLLVVIVGMISGTGFYVMKSRNSANQSYANADKTSANTTTSKLAKTDTKNQQTVKTATDNTAPAPAAAPQVTQPAPVIVHPSQNNCNNQQFTAYVSNKSGTHAYYQANSSSKIFKDYAYKTSVTLTCSSSYPTDGWGLTTNYWVPFSDLSLNPI